ncbi:MAG: substrate-binding domain-containing protein [Dehalococcoidia bacterium]|jgi:tungstate transport system substrate-binding protein
MKRIQGGILGPALLLSLTVLACGGSSNSSAPTSQPTSAATQASSNTPASGTPVAATTTPVVRSGPKDIILATTTSTQDTGLLDVLVPAFDKETGYNVKVIAVGTGQALAMGESGDADVMLVHAPSSEKKVVDEGIGLDRRLVMHNDFVLLGPSNDPAGVKGTTVASDALTKIYNKGAAFISRGDDSGTDKLEKALWQKAGLDPKGKSWYDETGQGMGASLQVANQRDAYIMSDRGTFLATQKSLSLGIVLEGDPQLLNVYSVMEVNPQKFSLVNAAGGKAFADFMVSDEAQTMIKTFGIDKYGQALFTADAGKTYESVGLATPFG